MTYSVFSDILRFIIKYINTFEFEVLFVLEVNKYFYSSTKNSLKIILNIVTFIQIKNYLNRMCEVIHHFD